LLGGSSLVSPRTLAALIERWNGSTWTQQTEPSPAGAPLLGVSCTLTTNCEAVGGSNAGGPGRTLKWQHLDGPMLLPRREERSRANCPGGLVPWQRRRLADRGIGGRSDAESGLVLQPRRASRPGQHRGSGPDGAGVAEQLHGTERDETWHKITEAVPRFAQYQHKTDRQSPEPNLLTWNVLAFDTPALKFASPL
jgi:hypothetical protein